MSRNSILKSILSLWAVITVAGAGSSGGQLTVQVQTQAITQVRGTAWLQYVGKQVTLRGFYYDGSIPMIVDKYELVLIDIPLPTESYVPIVGKTPPGVSSGDEISITGLMIRPTVAEPKYAQKEKLVLKLEDANKVKILSKRTPALTVSRKLWTQTATLASRAQIIKDLPLRFAVLIAGGINEANNHKRYWNDLKTMYSILLANGYWKDNIYVVFADGEAKDADMPVNFKASRENVRKVFDDLAKKMTANDTLYIMLNDHGGGFLTAKYDDKNPGNYGGILDANGDEEANVLEDVVNIDINRDGDKKDAFAYDEVLCLWGEDMTDDEFASQVNKITKSGEIIIQMKQCFCGGFIRDLRAPGRVLMASTDEVHFSFAHSEDYGEFTYRYFSALLGHKPDDEKSAVDADADQDGFISVAEAYNYARSHDTAAETPLFEDDGRIPAHAGKIPNGGDGDRSAKIYLAKAPKK